MSPCVGAPFVLLAGRHERGELKSHRPASKPLAPVAQTLSVAPAALRTRAMAPVEVPESAVLAENAELKVRRASCPG